MEDLIDHIQGLEWKTEPLLVEFSASENVQSDFYSCIIFYLEIMQFAVVLQMLYVNIDCIQSVYNHNTHFNYLYCIYNVSQVFFHTLMSLILQVIFNLFSFFLYIVAFTQNVCGTEWPFMR